MSKAHQPPHRNSRTQELLQNDEQVCPVCFENFTSTRAGDLHRVGAIGTPERGCANPKSVGLIAKQNEFGTSVWSIKK